MIIFNILKMVRKRGPDIKRRDARRARNALTMLNTFSYDKAEEEASDILSKFSKSCQTTVHFEQQIKKFP